MGDAQNHPMPPTRGGAPPGAHAAILAIASVTVIALALRLAHLFADAQGPFGAAGYLPIDARTYHAWARDWLAGSWPPAQPYFRPPLYTWFVGAVYAVAGPEPIAVKVVQAMLGAVTSTLVWATARELFAGTRVALLAAAIWAFCGTSIFFDAQLLPGSLDAFLQTALVWRLLVAGRTQRLAAWSSAGVIELASLSATNSRITRHCVYLLSGNRSVREVAQPDLQQSNVLSCSKSHSEIGRSQSIVPERLLPSMLRATNIPLRLQSEISWSSRPRSTADCSQARG